MCAIVDANVISEMFGGRQPKAGVKFLDWVDQGKGILVLGGRVSQELAENNDFRRWAQAADEKGRILRIADKKVSEEERIVGAIRDDRGMLACRSNDKHVIALARVSGARLLYTNDKDLQKDFKNPKLIREPRGKVYTTVHSGNFTRARRETLRDANCSV